MSGMNSKMSAAFFALLVMIGVLTGISGIAGKNTHSEVCAVQTAVSMQDEASSRVMIQTEMYTEYVDVVRNSVKLDIKGSAMNPDSVVEEELNETDDTSETVGETEKPATVIGLSNEDYENLLRIVEAEATDGDMKSKILVADVVINRVKSPLFPGSVTEVVCQGNGEQFQPVMDGRFYSVNVTGSTYEAVDRALYGEDYSEGATYFAAVSSAGPSSWHALNLRRLFEYGGHVFFIPY